MSRVELELMRLEALRDGDLRRDDRLRRRQRQEMTVQAIRELAAVRSKIRRG